jgi:hypothetical protein
MEAAGYAEAIEGFNKILDNFCKELESFVLQVHQSLPKTHQLLSMKLQLMENPAKAIVANLSQAGILTSERSFNSSLLGSVGFVPAIASDDVPPQNNMPNTEYLRVLNAHFKKKSETGISGSKTGNITPFQFQDLNKSTGQTSTIENVDFGESYSGYRKQIAINYIRKLHLAYSADYSGQRKNLAQTLGQSVGANMMRKLQTGLIQPASSLVVNAGVNKMHSLMQEHNQRVRELIIARGGKSLSFIDNGTTGLSAGDSLPKTLFNILRERQEERKVDGFFEKKALALIKALDKIDKSIGESLPDIRVLTTFLRKCNIRENSIPHKACRALDLRFNQKTFP